MDKETLEAAIAGASSKATYIGSGGSILGYIASSEFAVISGIILGLAGFAVNWYYKAKADRRAELDFELRRSRIAQEMQPAYVPPKEENL